MSLSSLHSNHAFEIKVLSGNVKYYLTASLGAGHEAGEYLRHIYFKLRSLSSARTKEFIIVK